MESQGQVNGCHCEKEEKGKAYHFLMLVRPKAQWFFYFFSTNASIEIIVLIYLKLLVGKEQSASTQQSQSSRAVPEEHGWVRKSQYFYCYIRILLIFWPSTQNRPAEARPPKFTVILTSISIRGNEFQSMCELY